MEIDSHVQVQQEADAYWTEYWEEKDNEQEKHDEELEKQLNKVGDPEQGCEAYRG